MKYSKIIILYFILLFGLNVSLISLHLAATELIVKVPNESQVMKGLFRNLDATFPISQSCNDNKSSPTIVRDYMQTILTYLAEEKSGGNQVSVKCNKTMLNKELIDFYSSTQGAYSKNISKTLRKMKRGEPLYQCEVSFNYASGENVWSRGIQFLFRGKNSQVVKHSFRCLITP